MNRATIEERIILTHDCDYGELIFKYHYRPPGVILFKMKEFDPWEPAQLLLDLLEKQHDFNNKLSVIDADSIRERKY